MGLLSTEVEVRLNPQNIEYYENLGYIIPRYYNEKNRKYMVKKGTTIVVKIEDLPKCSNVMVDLTCDYCGKELTRSYQDYNKRKHNGKCYCKRCGKIVLCSGENNPNWNPSLTDEERQNGRNYPEYTEFIKKVLARDNYTCQCCGDTNSSEMEVHHLYGYYGYPEYRTDQTQAITLCKKCHGTFHVWYMGKFGYINKGNCTRNDYEKWSENAINELHNYEGEIIVARKVYDYETKTIYDSAYECAKMLNVKDVLVYQCCNHKIITNNTKRKDGTISTYQTTRYRVKGHHLFWLEEYNNLTEEELKQYIRPIKPKRLKKNTKPTLRTRKVVCVTTGEIFEQIKFGGEKYGLRSIYKISENCNGSIKSAGKLPDGTPLKWMYYEDFLKLSQEEQNEILARNKDSSDGESFNM